MPWVRRLDPLSGHSCPKPTTEPDFDFQSPPRPLPSRPDGALGDLWRCPGCRRLWRIGPACTPCDLFGFTDGHRYGGSHMLGTGWRPARPGQRLRHWRTGRR